MKARNVFLLGLVMLPFGLAVGATQEGTKRFVFDLADNAPTGATLVRPDDVYNDNREWGYEQKHSSGTRAPTFSAKLREGNYIVTIVMGGGAIESNTTVKAEQRRLMLEAVRTAKGEIIRRSFVVNI